MNVQKKIERPTVHKDVTELAHELNGAPQNPSAKQNPEISTDSETSSEL
jgi:hypothetical protein